MLFSALVFGCVHPTEVNFLRCGDWLVAHLCGDYDVTQLVDCNGFGIAFYPNSCDNTAFFDCLAEHYTCDTGGPEDVATVDMWACVDELVCLDP